MSADTRMVYLDSLRGLAAYIVVIGHFFPGEWKSLPIFNLITDTKLAVAIFFILSGIVLTNSNRGARPELFDLIIYGVARFFRLFIPVFAVTVFVWCLYSFDLMFFGELPSDYLAWAPYLDFYRSDVDVIKLIHFSSVEAFLVYDPDTTLIPPAWTMRPELFGSFAILFYVWLVNRGYCSPKPLMLIGISVGLILTTGHLPFVHFLGYFLMGSALRHLADAEVNVVPHPEIFLLTALVAKTISEWLGLSDVRIDFLFSALIVICLMQASSLHAFMCKPALLWLGKVSFPLYLLHVPLIMSFGLHMMHFLSSNGISSQLGQWIVFFCLSALLFMFSGLFMPFERLAIQTSRAVRRLARR